MTPLRLACILLVALGSVAGCSTSGGVVSDRPPRVGDWHKFGTSTLYEIVEIKRCGASLCAWLAVVGEEQINIPRYRVWTLGSLVRHGGRIAGN